jgi:hypothetical protein
MRASIREQLGVNYSTLQQEFIRLYFDEGLTMASVRFRVRPALDEFPGFGNSPSASPTVASGFSSRPAIACQVRGPPSLAGIMRGA